MKKLFAICKTFRIFAHEKQEEQEVSMRKPDIIKGIERILNDVIAAEYYVKISDDDIILNTLNDYRINTLNCPDYLEDLFTYVGEYFGVDLVDDDLSLCLTFADLANIIQEKQHDNTKK